MPRPLLKPWQKLSLLPRLESPQQRQPQPVRQPKREHALRWQPLPPPEHSQSRKRQHRRQPTLGLPHQRIQRLKAPLSLLPRPSPQKFHVVS